MGNPRLVFLYNAHQRDKLSAAICVYRPVPHARRADYSHLCPTVLGYECISLKHGLIEDSARNQIRKSCHNGSRLWTCFPRCLYNGDNVLCPLTDRWIDPHALKSMMGIDVKPKSPTSRRTSRAQDRDDSNENGNVEGQRARKRMRLDDELEDYGVSEAEQSTDNEEDGSPINKVDGISRGQSDLLDKQSLASTLRIPNNCPCL